MSWAPRLQSAFSSARELAEIQAVAVDVEDPVAKLTRVGELLQLPHARVVLEQVPNHQYPAACLRGCDRPLGVGDGLGERLLDKAMLAGLQHPYGELGVARDWSSEHHGVECRVLQQLIEIGGCARSGKLRGHPLARGRRRVATPRELASGECGEVAGQVGPPVAKARDTDSQTRLVHSSHELIHSAV
jgi:hypothetical protein